MIILFCLIVLVFGEPIIFYLKLPFIGEWVQMRTGVAVETDKNGDQYFVEVKNWCFTDPRTYNYEHRKSLIWSSKYHRLGKIARRNNNSKIIFENLRELTVFDIIRKEGV